MRIDIESRYLADVSRLYIIYCAFRETRYNEMSINTNDREARGYSFIGRTGRPSERRTSKGLDRSGYDRPRQMRFATAVSPTRCVALFTSMLG